MQRLHLLRWVALAMCLVSTQCVDSLSDDCSKTLTCGDEPRATLDAECTWRFPDGGVWAGAPVYDATARRWEWLDGRPTETQDFGCTPGAGPSGMDGGVDGGDGQPDCRTVGCDEPLLCDAASRRCVECQSDAHCASNTPVGDAGVAAVCDTVSKECVQCLTVSHCSGATPVCKVVPGDSSRNECVECTVDGECSPSAPVCDLRNNECTARCTALGECSGAEKPVCNVPRQICVECIDATSCSGSTAECNTQTNECVQCTSDTPCLAMGQVCDASSNRCVQCRENAHCNGTTPFCETESNVCVQCLGDTQCGLAETSRCNIVEHVCVGCTADAQCENGTLCRVSDGRCVGCLDADDCSGVAGECEGVSGLCVACLNTSHCVGAETARCETRADPPGIIEPYTCQGCTDNSDCANKPGLGALCNESNGVCVDCVENGDCASDPALSLCADDGVCAPCNEDPDCGAISGLNACLTVPAGNRCVECVDNPDCQGNADGAVCKTTNGGVAVGPAAVNTCVECMSNADCTSPTASRCVANECQPCLANGDCSTLTGLGVCDTSRSPVQCVQCTGLQRQACANGANVCNSLTRQCTTFAVGEADGVCDVCVSDAHCATDSRCVLQAIGNGGHFCFPVSTPTCATSPFSVVTTGTIDSTSQTACLLRRTTCAGFLDFGLASCGTSDDCGEDNVNDGICAGSGVCTLPCTAPSDCAGGTCFGGACELP